MLKGDNKRMYHIWYDMHRRCKDKRRGDYARYGGRGICVSSEWDKYPAFREWALSNGYHSTLSLDRIENDKDYSPENCRWATAKQQCNNKRNNHVIEFSGQKHTMMEWSEITGISYFVIRSRIARGWPNEKVFSHTGDGGSAV